MAEGDRLAELAQRTTDPISKGRALLRAHNYYRSSDFFLLPDDPRRQGAWKKNIDTFYQGLDVLHVAYERITVPYGNSHLDADYYPAGLLPLSRTMSATFCLQHVNSRSK